LKYLSWYVSSSATAANSLVVGKFTGRIGANAVIGVLSVYSSMSSSLSDERATMQPAHVEQLAAKLGQPSATVNRQERPVSSIDKKAARLVLKEFLKVKLFS
jgi:RNase H-fold protein (predicted Holliday junction resolvase)